MFYSRLRRSRSNAFPADDPAFQAKFVEMDNKLEKYKQSLRAVLERIRATPSTSRQPPGGPLRPYATRCMLFTQTLAFCATIKLHTPLHQDWDINTSRTLSNALQATDILQELDIATVGYVDPFIGVSVFFSLPELGLSGSSQQILWTMIAQVLVRALTVGRTLRSASSRNSPSGMSLLTTSNSVCAEVDVGGRTRSCGGSRFGPNSPRYAGVDCYEP